MHICYCKLFIDVLQQNVIYCALVIEHARLVCYLSTSGVQEIHAICTCKQRHVTMTLTIREISDVMFTKVTSWLQH